MKAPALKTWLSCAVWSTALLLGCAGGESYRPPGARNDHGSGSADSTQRAPDTLSAKPPDEAKPSEEGEGVPGYLVDPDAVVVQHDAAGGRVRLEAGAGAFVASDGAAAAVVVSAWQVEASRLGELVSDGQTPIAAIRLGGGATRPDGSIEFEFFWDGQGVVIFSTAAQTASDYVLLATGQTGRTDTAVIEQSDGGERLVDIGAFDERKANGQKNGKGDADHGSQSHDGEAHTDDDDESDGEDGDTGQSDEEHGKAKGKQESAEPSEDNRSGRKHDSAGTDDASS